MSDSLPQRVHITGCVSTDISKDGKTAMLVFNIADKDDSEKKFAITCSTDHLPLMRLIFHEAICRTKPVPFDLARSFYSIGSTGQEEIGVIAGQVTNDKGEQHPIVVLRMSPDTAGELSFAVGMETALKLPTVIHQVVQSMQDKQRIDASSLGAK